MTYELWDTEDGNLVGTYRSEPDVLEAVRDAVEALGQEYADALTALCVQPGQEPRVFAEGAGLIARAMSAERRPLDVHLPRVVRTR